MASPHALGGAVDLAHAVHYGIVFAGLAGLAALLAPAATARWVPSGPPVAHDDHERRVLDLREQIRVGTLVRPAGTSAPPRPVRTRPRLGDAVLPVLAVSSAAAAGVHAAVTPAHLPAGAAVATFFVLTAWAQLAWTGLSWWHPTETLLRAGAVGNAAVLTLWLVTRTVGLPDRETAGPWDVASVVWELVIVAGCLHLLRSGVARPTWHPLAAWWLGASVVALGVLSVSGAPA